MSMIAIGRKTVGRTLIAMMLWVFAFIPLSAIAAGSQQEISHIKVEKGKNETSVIIEGGYQAYRAFALEAPPRLVIDLEGTRLDPDLPRLLEVNGPVISKIRVGEGENRSRLVLDSFKKDEPFHFNIGEKENVLVVKCWLAGPTKKAPARTSEYKSKADLSSQVPGKELRDILGLTKEEKGEKQEEGSKISKYSGTKIAIDFYQADLHNVFRLFGEITGKNFIVDESVTGTLTLSLRDVPWDLALDIITDMKNLDREEKHDILVIKPKAPQKTQGELVVRTVSDQALYPARLLKREQEEEQKARELILRAYNLEKEGKKEEALALYEGAFDLWKKNIDLVKKTTYLHYSLGQYARSYFFAKEALKLDTQDAEAALYAALSASQIGKEDEARLFFEAAINSKPKLREAYYNYGLFLEKSRNWSNALYTFQRYEEIFGPSLDVSLAMARVYEGEGRKAEACKRYREISFSGFSPDEVTEGVIQEKMRSLCGQGG